jgi:putative ABC transport system permease protein
MFDLRLVNSYGWSDDQLEQVKQLEGIVDAEGTFYTDLIAAWGEDGEDSVYRFYTMPETINRLVLLGGRMPQAPNEILADGYHADKSILGSQVKLSSANEEDALDTAVYDTYTVVGYVSTPLYMDMNRGTTSVGSGSIDNYFFATKEAFDADYYTEIYVTMPGEWKIYSDKYNDAMDDLGEKLKPQVEDLAWERLEQVKQDAEEEYADGYAEYQDGVREYWDGMHEAYEEAKQGK